jgi:long-chain acyl-CoA synthetase
MTDDGWFHTGEIGQITSEGFLRITDRKKALFKLSTGNYVMPQPLENRLSAHPLIEQAVVVGPGQKYCAALIFVDQDTLRIYASAQGLGEDIPIDRLVRHPKILLRYQELVELANEGMDHWMTIKRFRLMTDHLSIENGMLTPTLKVKRKNVHDRYRDAIDAIYLTSEPEGAIAPEPSPA